MGSPTSPPEETPQHRSDNTDPGFQFTKKGVRFWILFVAIALSQFLAALDSSVLSTALPTITAELESGPLYIWMVNSYLLASTAFGPIFGQASNIFGRRILTILAVVAFAVGSLISGLARSSEMLIAGRTIQGIGGAGCVVMPEILICDLVSLRERGTYVALLTACWGSGTFVAPLIGGALAQHSTWRWIFFLNLPICAVALVPLSMLRLRNPNNDTFFKRLGKIDWAGNVILVLAIVSLLLSLTWAGTKNPWASWQTLVPLILGILGLLAFGAYESGSWLPDPTMPPRLFSNRNAAGGYATSFLHGMMLFWTAYFLPLYFQAVLGASPLQSAVNVLPLICVSGVSGVIAGFLTTLWGKYLHWHFIGWALMAVGAGLFSMLGPQSSTATWAGFQCVFGFGIGVIFTTQLPGILASLAESDVAIASATWIFVRNLGSIWGMAVPAAVFNTRADEMALDAADVLPEDLRVLLVRGGAYEHATKAFMDTLRAAYPAEVYDAVLRLYTGSLDLVWQVAIGFCVLGFFLCFFMRNLTLSQEHNTEWGLDEISSGGESDGGGAAAVSGREQAGSAREMTSSQTNLGSR